MTQAFQKRFDIDGMPPHCERDRHYIAVAAHGAGREIGYNVEQAIDPAELLDGEVDELLRPVGDIE